jgi:GNAT superfamily N-acetyltransferase
VRDFAPSDLDGAARLLAARFGRAREQASELSSAARDAEACRRSLEPLVASSHVRGALATWAGEPIGFLLGQRSLLAPNAAPAYFNPAFSVGTPLHGHAITAAEDPLDVYRAMWAHLSRGWVTEGFLDHGIGFLAGERGEHDAFVALGFGRHFSLGLRAAEPLAEPTRADLEIRTATEKELPEVFALLAEQRAFHASAPMVLPNLRILHAAQEGVARELIGQPRCPTFVAYQDGRALGMQLFAPASFISWPLRDDATVYLFQGVVSERERGGGVGAALLQHSLAWMRREGVRRCGLHYLAANPSGAPFWSHHGFRAAEHFLHRTVDARMAWSAR